MTEWERVEARIRSELDNGEIPRIEAECQLAELAYERQRPARFQAMSAARRAYEEELSYWGYD